ncbi:MAG: PilZ domain-containing protein [Actinobacteria bacterium]|nr:PilZ domain-containing protein [Actinomycetota bacterium]
MNIQPHYLVGARIMVLSSQSDYPLREAIRSVGAAGSKEQADSIVRAVATGSARDVLRAETWDLEARRLDGVVATVRLIMDEPSGLLQTRAGIRVLVHDPAPVVFAIVLTGGLEVIQRRQAVRARARLDVEMLRADLSDPEEVADASKLRSGRIGQSNLAVAGLRAETLDISAGGMRISTAQDISVGTDWLITIYLPPTFDPLRFVGRVIEVQPGRHARIAFHSVPEAVAQALSRFAYATITGRSRPRRI